MGLIRHSEFTEITHVSSSPIGLTLVTKASTKEEGIEALFTTREIVRSISSSPAKVADGFISDRG